MVSTLTPHRVTQRGGEEEERCGGEEGAERETPFENGHSASAVTTHQTANLWQIYLSPMHSQILSEIHSWMTFSKTSTFVITISAIGTSTIARRSAVAVTSPSRRSLPKSAVLTHRQRVR